MVRSSGLLRSARRVSLVAALVGGCASHAGPSENAQATPPLHDSPSSGAHKGSALDQAWDSYEASRYREAEAAFRSILARGEPRAKPGLASVLVATGRYAEAEALASETTGADVHVALELVVLRAEAMLKQGKLDAAETHLASAAGDPAARAVRVLYGEVLIERGKTREAEPVLMARIEH